jgi:hypothetical protein
MPQTLLFYPFSGKIQAMVRRSYLVAVVPVPTFPFPAGIDDDMTHTKARVVNHIQLSDLCKISWGAR